MNRDQDYRSPCNTHYDRYAYQASLQSMWEALAVEFLCGPMGFDGARSRFSAAMIGKTEQHNVSLGLSWFEQKLYS